MTAIHADSSDASETVGRAARLRWSHPKQKLLLLLSLGVTVGAFMPWLETAVGTYRGFAGPGQYLFYAGVLGLGAGLVPVKSLAVLQGAVVSSAAIFLPLWQAAKLFSKVGFDGWAPGTGMMLVLGCGIMAARTTISMARSDQG